MFVVGIAVSRSRDDLVEYRGETVEAFDGFAALVRQPGVRVVHLLTVAPTCDRSAAVQVGGGAQNVG
jgi:hypothetical protein